MVLPSAYNDLIPQPTDELDQSQLDLLNNFGALFTFLQENHVAFASADAGKHKWVSLPSQGASPATLNTEIALFSAISGYTNNIEMGWRRQNNGAVIDFTSSLQAATGWTFLPSGLLIKWGIVAVSGPGAVVVNYPVAATNPVFANTFIVLASPVSASSVIQTTATSNIAFTATLSAASSFVYLAIGN